MLILVGSEVITYLTYVSVIMEMRCRKFNTKPSKNADYCAKYRQKKKFCSKRLISEVEIQREDEIVSPSIESSPETLNIVYSKQAITSQTLPLDNIIFSEGSSILESESNNTLFTTTEKSKKLLTFLNQWSIENDIKICQLTNLLKGFNKILPEFDLPVDGRTILKTEPTIPDIIPFDISDGNSGQFIYFGIKKALDFYLNIPNLIPVLKSGINLIFNVDGLPIFKSSRKQIWPILGRIYISDDVIFSPFPVAIFCGIGKPTSIEKFLGTFIVELSYLISNGISLGDNIISVKLLGFTCDAPARSFIRGTVGHNSKVGCDRCCQKGSFCMNRIVYSNVIDIKRTHENFVNNVYIKYKISNSPLLSIPNFDIIADIALDYMHLCCLGVMRKLLIYWTLKSKLAKLPVILKTKLSNRLKYYSNKIPLDFSRKPRTLDDLLRFKATEFRLILLYMGPCIFKNILKKHIYEHFLTFHASIRILLYPKFVGTPWILTAKKMLASFVKNFTSVYGTESCIYNVHSLLHLADDVEHFNVTLNAISCFPFENFLGRLKKLIRKPSQPLTQLCKRLSENPYMFVNYENTLETSIANSKLNRSQKFIVINNFKIKFGSNSQNDCYVFLKDNRLFKITESDEHGDLIGFIASSLDSLYEYPICSKYIGMFKFKHFLPNKCRVQIQDITYKAFVMNCGNYYAAFELLHLVK